MPGGGFRPKIRPIRTRILAGQTRSTHQCQGTFGFHSDHKKSSKTQRKSFPVSRQHHSLLVSKKARGKNGKIQPSSETIPSMVHGKTHHFRCSISKKFRHARRSHFKTPHGQRRLHPKLGIIPLHGEKILPLACPTSLHGGHVCLSRQQKISQICVTPPSLGGMGGGCHEHVPGSGPFLLQQPPMDANSIVAQQAASSPPHHLLDSGALLGFKCMVSPTKENAGPRGPSLGGTPLHGNVSELHGRINACAKMAPSFLSIVRTLLQREQISLEAQNTYVAQLGNPVRYDWAFRKLYALCQINGINPETASIMEIAGQISQLNALSPSDARNAYSACLALPGMAPLRFNVLLQKCRKTWSTSQPKYSEFWDVEKVLARMSSVPLDSSSVMPLRDRLILVLRFFHLMRSIDCARIKRTISFMHDRPFILIRRKGWTQHRWEEIISLPDHPSISPWHLMKKYVQLTHDHGTPDGPLFLSILPPYTPLTADRIGIITLQHLHAMGVPHGWGAHSTRGAAVAMYKN